MKNPRLYVDQLPAYQAKWDQLILSTEPVDRPKAEKLINKIYEQMDRQHPRIIWIDSPWHAFARTNKFIEPGIPVNTKAARHFGKILNRATYENFEKRTVGTALRRLGLQRRWGFVTLTPSGIISRGPIFTLSEKAKPEQITQWEGTPILSLSPATYSLISLMWKDAQVAFYYTSYDTFAMFDWLHNAVGMTHETNPAALLVDLAQVVPWWRPHEGTCFVSERPSRLTISNTRDPAIVWGDKKFYMIDGVEVEPYVVTTPKEITINDILTNRNTEVRRIMINRYKKGIGDFLKDAKAKKRDHDERYGTLWHIPRTPHYTSHLYTATAPEMFYLEVVNRTPEPDGTFKHYFLRMPPSVDNGKGGTRMLNTSKEAYDWSWWGLPVSTWDMTES